jgi:hypothetical protein
VDPIHVLSNVTMDPIRLNGKFRGENILLTRIAIISTDEPIQFKRLQFPIRSTFEITINKSQSQTISVCGLDFNFDMFFTRTIIRDVLSLKPSSFFVLVKDGITKNIVHSVVLRD